MNLKNKIARKALSWLISIIMIVSTIGFNPSFSAFANEQQEVDFCVDKMKNLPTDDEFLSQMRKLPTEEYFNQSRHQKIFHSDGSEDFVDLDEKEIYEKIKKTVEGLTKELETQESAEEMLDFAYNLEGEDDKEKIQTENSNDLPANMQKADAIYRWVAKNIHYDFESADCEKTLAERKPQDAYFVFSQKTGVCVGYARLLNLMMRMAQIPCMYVRSINGPTENCGHAFNAVYLEGQNQDRKGWTLLDSCWASPDGSDGDAEIKKHLGGEDFFRKHNMENVLAEKNNYTDELFDEFKIPEKYINGIEKPSQEFVDDLNKKIPDILKKLNEKYKDSPHFETFEFFVYEWGSLGFKYETNLTMEQAKQAKDKLKEIGKRQKLEGTLNCLTGKSKLNCGVMPSVDSEKNDFRTMMGEELSAELLTIHAKNLQDKVWEYGDELQKTYIDVLFSQLDRAKENIEDVNEELNKKLGELNENYSDITPIKKINLSAEKSSYDVVYIMGAFDTELDEQDLKARFEQYYKANDPDAAKKESGFAEYFPAFYKKDQSFEEANERIVAHTFHKISEFEDFKPTDSFSMETYERKINTPNLVGNEGKAAIDIYWTPREIKEVIVYDSTIKIDDQEYSTFGLEIVNIQNIENLIVEGNIKTDIVSVKNALIKDNVKIKIIYDVENLTIEGDATIDFSTAWRLKEIDTTKSRKYHAENGILYHTVNDQIGTKGEKISEIPPRSTDLG